MTRSTEYRLFSRSAKSNELPVATNYPQEHPTSDISNNEKITIEAKGPFKSFIFETSNIQRVTHHGSS